VTPDAIEACAREIETLTWDRDRWRDAYVRLANNRAKWVWLGLQDIRLNKWMSHDATKRMIGEQLTARLRRTW
jgi:hypothetical protein